MVDLDLGVGSQKPLHSVRRFKERAELQRCSRAVARVGEHRHTVQMDQKLPELDKDEADCLDIARAAYKSPWHEGGPVIEEFLQQVKGVFEMLRGFYRCFPIQNRFVRIAHVRLWFAGRSRKVHHSSPRLHQADISITCPCVFESITCPPRTGYAFSFNLIKVPVVQRIE